jgi:hypothetical protein
MDFGTTSQRPTDRFRHRSGRRKYWGSHTAFRCGKMFCLERAYAYHSDHYDCEGWEFYGDFPSRCSMISTVLIRDRLSDTPYTNSQSPLRFFSFANDANCLSGNSSEFYVGSDLAMQSTALAGCMIRNACKSFICSRL